MAQAALTPAQKHDAYALVTRWGNISRASMEARIPRATLQHRYHAFLADQGKPHVEVPIAPAASRLPQGADECWEFLDAAIGRRRKTVMPSTTEKRPKFSDKRIVIAGDFHAPFEHTEAVALMLAETQGYDQIIVNGDLQDFYSASRFVHKEYVPIEREMAAVDALLAHFAAQYPDVLLVDGNHDRPRFEKALRAQLSLELMSVIEYLTGGNLSAIKVVAKRYPNVRFAPIQVGRHAIAWCAQEGDILCSHAEKYSKVPGSALRVIEEWFSDQHETLGLKPWRLLVQAHTHMGAWFPWRSDKLLVEGFCLSQTHSYQLDSKIAGRGQRLGYVTLTQRDGVTNLRSVQPQWLDPQLRAA